MSDPYVNVPQNPPPSKAKALADALNHLLNQLVIKCAKGDSSNPMGVRDFYDVAILGYNEGRAYPGFQGTLAGKTMHSISTIANSPLRIESRMKKVFDGAGGLVDMPVKLPVWIEPASSGGTPMTAAFSEAYKLLEAWVQAHPNSFPPIVIHITDGESTDGDPSSAMNLVRSLSTVDGNVLLFNLHTNVTASHVLSFPGSEAALPDAYAKTLFDNSSLLPEFMKIVAQAEYGMSLSDDAKAFVLNGDIDLIITALDIGTRPALALR